MERCRLVFSGAGGQGVITAAIVLAEAAVRHAQLNATQTQSYGPEARGGATRADVIIADTDIRFPKVTQPNVLVCLTQEAYNKYQAILRPGGLLLTDARFVKIQNNLDAWQVQLPMHQAVTEQIGKPVVLNICMLGAVLAMTDLVPPEAILKTLAARLNQEYLTLNRQALELGQILGRPYKR